MKGYIKHKKLGEGTYATIFLGVPFEEAPSKIVTKEIATNDISTEDCVAIKRIKKSAYSTGQEISAVREIKALKNIESPYVVQLKEVFIFQKDIFMILEYMECDLENILKSPSILIMPGDIKAWLYMLLCGLNECHKRLMIHRDIKPNNLLIGRNGYLKLGDFGLTRRVANDMTPGAITRWYRAPEMLLGASSYSFAADMWSVGAVFAEMFLRVPFFAAETDLQQLELIFKALGTPSAEEWPGMKELPGYFEFKRVEGPALEQLFSAATPDALDLMQRLLQFNPVKRITCQEALSHPYFSSLPTATEPRALPIVLRDLKNLPSVSSGDSM